MIARTSRYKKYRVGDGPSTLKVLVWTIIWTIVVGLLSYPIIDRNTDWTPIGERNTKEVSTKLTSLGNI